MESEKMSNEIPKAMTTHRQIALAITHGRSFLNSLKSTTDAGAVTKEQLLNITTDHKLHPAIFDTYILVGAIAIHDLSELDSKDISFHEMSPGKKYLVVWKMQPCEEMAFAAALATWMQEKVRIYERFMLSCKLPAFTHCLRCDLVFPSRLGKKYCSDKCRSLDHHHRPQQHITLKKRVLNFLKKATDFISAL